jgi:ketosteroid isomerase-like protein
MKRVRGGVPLFLTILLVCLGASARAQDGQRPRTVAHAIADAASSLNGVYRIDINGSDKLYSVVAGASSNLPFGEQQRFFIDLAVRLTPPDLLAIERTGRRVTIGSSRAPRVTLVADGVVHTERADDGHLIRSRMALEGGRLVFTSSGRTEDNFSVVFASVEGGRRLRVTRRISAEQLNEPVIIQTIYNKISDSARWDIYGEAQAAREAREAREDVDASVAARPRTQPAAATTGAEGVEAAALREALDEWVAATNARDIEKQMSFYATPVKAFYLARNVSRAFVREEKARVFASAQVIDIRAEGPEIIFRDGGRTAIMRFRKMYRIENGSRSQRGAVVQELRWQRAGGGWKIFSERDIRVIR